jgi:hypothetical protein
MKATDVFSLVLVVQKLNVVTNVTCSHITFVPGLLLFGNKAMAL